MAQMITILGAILGFVASIVGFFAFDIGLLAAFVIWAVSGPVAASFGFLFCSTDTITVRENRQSAFDAAA